MTLLNVVLGFLVAFLIVLIIRIIVFYVDTSIEINYDGGGKIRISYKQFEPLFKIDPDSYDLYTFQECGSCIRYTHPRPKNMIMYACKRETTLIYFKHYHEWLQAKWLLYKREVFKNQQMADEQMKKYIDSVKQSLRDFENDTSYYENVTIGTIRSENNANNQ